VHTYKNVGTTDSRILQMTEPAGFDQFFTRSAAEFARAGAPDMSRVTEIAAEHGIFFVTPQQIALRAALPAPKVLIHPPAENRVHRAFGDEVHLYLSGKETGHLFSQALVITQPGGGPPPHYHTQEDEWFHVLHGSVSFFYQGNWTEVRAGGRVWCPKGSVHTFQNTGDNPSQMLVTTSPAGFDRFFALCAAEFDNPEGPNMPRIMEIAAEHGIFFVEP
jgi:quercetin dioxygenase-like cupin family protein